MAQGDAGEFEHAIVFLDIQGFNRPDRATADRVHLRNALQDICGSLLGGLEVRPTVLETTGDGLLVVLPPEFDPARLLTRFLPELDARLRRHNGTNPAERQIRVRAVASQGLLRRDAPALTGGGVVGPAINSASRLLDSRHLREDLARAGDRAVAVMAGPAFHASIVLARVPGLAPEFRRVLVRAKDGTYEGWLHRPGLRRPLPPPVGTRLDLEDLRPHLFLSPFDVHVFDLYRRMVQTAPPLAWQLATALLLSEGAIVHCADPYRRDEVRTVLEHFQDFVDSGEILFLLGSSISDIRRDYPDYLENKARGYASTGLGSIDVRSLEGPRRESDSLRRAVDLLESSPLRLKRGYPGTGTFRDAIRHDIRPAEEVISGARPVRKIWTVNLSLYQLLTMSYASDGRVVRLITDKDGIEAFIEELDRLVQQPIVSRQIILTALRDHFGPALQAQRTLFHLIEGRIHSVYMAATAAPHANIEVTARRDEQSPYHFGHLRTHLQIVAGDPGLYDLSPATVHDLRESPEWLDFRGHHLSCMAELAALRLADRQVSPDAILRRHRRSWPGLTEILRRDI